MTTDDEPKRSVALVSLGCARNDVDGEELAAHLAEQGWDVVPDPAEADVALVNTCGFIESAKKDSIDAVLESADLKTSGRTRAVVAVGCLAQRYGRELAEELPEADAVLGFDDYPVLSSRLEAVLRGEHLTSHEPSDRRRLLPIAPAERPAMRSTVSVPGHGHHAVHHGPHSHDEAAPAGDHDDRHVHDHGRHTHSRHNRTGRDPSEQGNDGPADSDPTHSGGKHSERGHSGGDSPGSDLAPRTPTPVHVTEPPPGRLGGPTYRVVRKRLDHRPWAPLKIASGCDRRCTFCAIPWFRGAFVSRPPDEILVEAAWLADQGVREVLLVSENSTSYGKDRGDLKALEALLPRLAEVTGLDRIRVSYLQPAELRPALVEAICLTPKVTPYFDLSFQHASPAVLSRMRRFGSTESFLGLLSGIRELAPTAGVRSNVIVGFPGETEADLTELESFLVAARLDAVGVFGYSPEDRTEAAELDGQIDPAEITERRQRVSALVEELMARRAQERLGERVEILIEEHESMTGGDMPGGEFGGEAGQAFGHEPGGESKEWHDNGDTAVGRPGIRVLGRAAFQGPDVDGWCELIGFGGAEGGGGSAANAVPPVGSMVSGVVVETDGVDLLVEPT